MCFPDPKANQHSELTLEEAIAKYGSRVGVVYRLYCSKSNVSYVGETREVFKGKKLSRIKSHYAALKKGCHPCRKLQAAWDATGGASISDEILEVVAPVERKGIESTQKIRAREKYWQEKYNATDGQVESNWHYKLKALELKRLKDSGIINNAALVYFILKLKNPWCDRPLKVNPLELAVEWEIPESSVYEAIGKLREAEVICINEAEIVITWSAHSQQDDVSDNPESFQDFRMDSEIPECSLENQNEFQDSRMDSEISENRGSELSSSNSSGCPQTYSDYSNFIKTLSESERESFLEFGRKKASNLPHPPELPDKWIAANFTELYKQFLASPAGRAAKQEAIAKKYDWENDPRLMDWLHKAYYIGHPWTQEDEAQREERFAFLMWAQKTNAYAGRIADEPA